MNAQPATPPEPANENAPIDQDALSLKQLAQGILDRDFRPRVASVRRLAEAVLAEPPAKPKKDKAKKKKSAKAAGKKAGGKKRKLAKIPGQKKAK